MQDIVINITKLTTAVTQAGFGLPLILATNVTKEYMEFASLAEVEAEYASTTKAYDIAAAIFAQNPKLPQIAIVGVSWTEGVDNVSVLSAALNVLVESENDWFFLVADVNADATITALSAWIDTQKKMYFATTSTLGLAATLDSENTVIAYTGTDVYEYDYLAEAWVGKCGPYDPGSITWKFKNITGMSPVTITTTQLNTLHDDGGNTYVTKMGVNQTSEGLTTSGEYIDIVRGAYFIEARMKEEIASLFVNTLKVPYDNSGIAQVVDRVERVLKLAFANGIIADDGDGNPQYTITAPNRADISSNDIANRVLNGIEFVAVLAGAVHNVEIDGILTY